MRAADLLDEAARLIVADRARQHGDALECHRMIARLWSAYLDRKLEALDVARMMVLLKVARSLSGELNTDDFRDMAGYAALAGDFAEWESAQ